MSEPFPETVRSRAVALRGDNIHTGQITPIARVVEGDDALVRFAFGPLRFGPDGLPLPTDPFGDPDRRDPDCHRTVVFEIGQLQKEMLSRGLDDLGLMRTQVDPQADFEAHAPPLRPCAGPVRTPLSAERLRFAYRSSSTDRGAASIWAFRFAWEKDQALRIDALLSLHPDLFARFAGACSVSKMTAQDLLMGFFLPGSLPSRAAFEAVFRWGVILETPAYCPR